MCVCVCVTQHYMCHTTAKKEHLHAGMYGSTHAGQAEPMDV